MHGGGGSSVGVASVLDVARLKAFADEVDDDETPGRQP
jgi:hypothetical protein